MPHYVISPVPQRDIRAILVWTQEHFGERGRMRYESLLVQAIQDIAECPRRMGVQSRPEIAAAARTYHLWHSRDRVSPPEDRVHKPRHFPLFRVSENGQVEISRVLHDQMDLQQHLPDEYRPLISDE